MIFLHERRLFGLFAARVLGMVARVEVRTR